MITINNWCFKIRYGFNQEENRRIKQEIEEKIRQDIKSKIQSKKGIFKFLRENKLICKFDDPIDLKFNHSLKDGQIGIKSQIISSNHCDIRNIAVIRMDLVNVVEDFYSNPDSIDYINHKCLSKLNQFFNYLEKFILRGLDIIDLFDINEIKENISFNCFFRESDNNQFNVNLERDLYNAIVKVKSILNRFYQPPYILMSDSKTHTRGEIYGVSRGNPINLTRLIKKYHREIDEWIDLLFNADNLEKDDHRLVCIPKSDRNNFCLVEKEDISVNVSVLNNRIIIYWGGALQLRNSQSIQQIKLNLIKD